MLLHGQAVEQGQSFVHTREAKLLIDDTQPCIRMRKKGIEQALRRCHVFMFCLQVMASVCGY